MFHLDQRLAERSPHERVDNWVHARVDVGQSLSGIENQHSVVDIVAIAIRYYNVIQLKRHPGDGERRRDS